MITAHDRELLTYGCRLHQLYLLLNHVLISDHLWLFVRIIVPFRALTSYIPTLLNYLSQDCCPPELM